MREWCWCSDGLEDAAGCPTAYAECRPRPPSPPLSPPPHLTRNNEVVLSVRCVPNWLYRVAAVSIAAVTVVAVRRLRVR